MPLAPSTNETAPIPLTVTHVHEHPFCPRFMYFGHVLEIPERQGRRLLVQKVRRAHEERKRVNPNYLRKRLGVAERKFDVPMASAR
jgi:CRISPR-associated exonuclease Cas4